MDYIASVMLQQQEKAAAATTNAISMKEEAMQVRRAAVERAVALALAQRSEVTTEGEAACVGSIGRNDDGRTKGAAGEYGGEAQPAGGDYGDNPETEQQPDEPFTVTPDFAGSDLPAELQDKLTAAIRRQILAFTPDKSVPGLTHLEELKLKTTGPPVAIPPRRFPYAQQALVYEQIQSWLKHKITRPSSSPWSAPVVVVMKEGKMRLAIDYRELNKRLTDDHVNYPLTLIDSCLDVMAGAQYFTTVDVSGAFHYIPVAEEDKEKTRFVTQWGQYEFKGAPFGIKSLPGLWSRLADKVLLGLKWQIACVYMDDILVFSKTGEDHVRDVETVLQRIVASGLKFHTDKCRWAQPSVDYVGFVISRDGIRPLPKTVKAITNYPMPKSIGEGRSFFLALASYNRRFIPGFATTAGPLNDLLKKNQHSKWEEEHTKAFEALRGSLLTPPVLAYPDFSKPFLLYTDASSFGLGAILAQQYEEDGEGAPACVIFNASRALRGTEKGYSPTH